MENSRGVVGQTVVVILAAGKGTRAGRDDLDLSFLILIATIGVISTMPSRGMMRRNGARIGSVIRSRKTTIGL